MDDVALDQAARTLAAGDALAALKRVALRDDAPALALRGIAMARLGEFADARALLQRAMRGFGPRQAVARARCLVADAEVALAIRDVAGPPTKLLAALQVLEAGDDAINAAHARTVLVRRSLLLGRLAEARTALRALDGAALPPALAASAALAAAELALRALRTAPAGEALAMARASAVRAGIPALSAEVATIAATLGQPAARRLARGGGTAGDDLSLADVEALFASGALVVDGCRRGVRLRDAWLPLATRPVLFGLACALADAWPGGAGRDALVAAAFRIRRVDETHRARLRVELGRLRALLAPWARIDATPDGFALRVDDGREVAVLAPPVDGAQAALQALLGDGEAWSTAAIALATGDSQRSVQRALAALEAAGGVRAVGRGRARRWVAPRLGGIATTLLLPAAATPA